MSGVEVAAIVVSVALALLAGGLLVTLASLTRTLRALRRSLDDLSARTLPLVDGLHGGVERANADLARVDDLLGTAESVTRTVEGASRLAYASLSNPVVKVLAFSAGLGRAGRRLRRGRR